MNNPAQNHYDAFLAGSYAWISRGLDEQIRKNKIFFSSHSVTPHDNRIAIDLGAGCGFQSVPLGQIGYSVTAVDFCQPLLDELRSHAGALQIITALLNPAFIPVFLYSDSGIFTVWNMRTRNQR